MPPRKPVTRVENPNGRLALLGFNALLAALPAIIAAAVLAFQAYVNAVKSEAKTDVLVKKTEEIHTLTNSNLTQITSELRVANEKIAGMGKLIDELMKTQKILTPPVPAPVANR